MKQFKTELDKKSESIIKREEVEQKVTEKVMKERESFTEQQKKELQEKKERELALCDEIRSKHEAKELQYLVCNKLFIYIFQNKNILISVNLIEFKMATTPKSTVCIL